MIECRLIDIFTKGLNMPDFLKTVWAFMQTIGRLLKDAWASVYAYGLYVRARFEPKPDGFEGTLSRIRANDPQLTHLDLSTMGLSYWNINELCYVLSWLLTPP